VEVDAPLEIQSGLWSTGQMGTGIIEQGLVAHTEGGLVIVTGCAHPGIDKMVARAMQVGQKGIALVMGGFHLGGARKVRIRQIIDEFRRLGVQQVAPCHCTGGQARTLFHEVYDQDFNACSVGWKWETQLPASTQADRDIPAQTDSLA